MLKKHLGYILTIVLLCTIYGCSSDYALKTPPTLDLDHKKKTEQLNEAIVLSVKSQSHTIEEYLIGPDDVLEIEAYNVDELKKTVRVNSQGDIALPLVGILRVKGLTTSKLEKLITSKIEKYVVETVVTVSVKEYRSQRISVFGAVAKPQVHAVTGQMYLIDMLMVSGGLTNDAGNICYLMRPTASSVPNIRTQTLVIDLDELLVKGNFQLNIPVFAGDVISVPKGGVVFIDGAVRSPGVYTMRGKITLVQAIAMAHGTDSLADPSNIRIFRDNGKGDRDVIAVDYDAVKKGQSPDILLAENDIVIVPVNGIKNFFSTIINSLRGAVSFGSGTSVGAGL